MSEIRPSNLQMCRGKLSYPTRAEATEARKHTGHYDLRVYRCPACDGFHLGRHAGSDKRIWKKNQPQRRGKVMRVEAYEA